MIQRYSRVEMREIWSEQRKLEIWLKIELLAAEALVKEGLVPAADFEQMKHKAAFSIERCKELERTLNHDVIAFTTNVAENIGAPASRWLHFGLTSSDVLDTAFAVQMVQSADILIKDVEALRTVIARRAKEHEFTPMIGRSHGIHAEPTTFGMKMALMHDEFGRALERLKAARERVAIGKLSGAVGTSAHLSPQIEAFVCERLGLRAAPIATQVI
ncbi:MAG: purB, partial [Verrucomicrobiales bacterium]|nr:purB [Verrucomicrobiales bacterium]